MGAGATACGGRNLAGRGRLGLAPGPGGSGEPSDLGTPCPARARSAVDQLLMRDIVEVISAHCAAEAMAGAGLPKSARPAT